MRQIKVVCFDWSDGIALKINPFQLIKLGKFFGDSGQMVVSQIKWPKWTNVATVNDRFKQLARSFVAHFGTTTINSDGTVSQIRTVAHDEIVQGWTFSKWRFSEYKTIICIDKSTQLKMNYLMGN